MASGRLRWLVVGAWMEVMDDLVFVALFAGMMLLAFGYVRLCERIVGNDSTEELS